MRLVVGPGKDGVVYKTADFHKPWTIGLTPDPAIQAKINELNAAAGADPRTSDRDIDQGDPACRPMRQGRRSPLRIARRRPGHGRDAHDLRVHRRGIRDHQLGWPARGPDVSESGHLRGDFCPSYTPPPFPITRGQSLAVLPFGNIAVTVRSPESN